MVTGTSKVVFYPVGNGDSSQIVLANGRRVLMDFRHQVNGEDKKSPVIDLNKQLRGELKESGRDYFDVVAFTHADLDHIAGFSDFFELWHASKYQGSDRIKIQELWVPAAVLLEPAIQDAKQDEFYLLRQEARHRLKLGKGIKVFSRPQALLDWLKGAGVTANRDACFVDAGTIVDGFSLNNDGVEFFVHSPFIEHCEGGDFIRNIASLIFNVRFNIGGFQCDYLAVGDSECEALDKIVAITNWHKRSDRLAWDLFNVPHHCSYKAVGPEKGNKETVPSDGVKTLLLSGKLEAYVVSSSNPIPDDKAAYDQIQPPHIQARNTYQKYLREVGGRKFLVTMEEPNGFYPEPLTFEISSAGLNVKRNNSTGAAMGILSAAAPRAGYK
jgi:hypothetical protein